MKLKELKKKLKKVKKGMSCSNCSFFDAVSGTCRHMRYEGWDEWPWVKDPDGYRCGGWVGWVRVEGKRARVKVSDLEQMVKTKVKPW